MTMSTKNTSTIFLNKKNLKNANRDDFFMPATAT